MTTRRIALLLGFLIFVGAMLLLRFDVTRIGENRIAHTDRLTGAVTICDETGCVKPPELHQPIGSTDDPNPLIKAWDEEQAKKRAK